MIYYDQKLFWTENSSNAIFNYHRFNFYGNSDEWSDTEKTQKRTFNVT